MWISCGFTGGAIAGGLISTALIPWGGWRSVFLVGGVLPLGIAAVMYWRLPESLLFLSLQHGAHDKLSQLLRRIAPDVDPGRDLHLARPEQVAGRGSPAKLFRDGRALMTLLLWLANFANLLNLFFLANWLPLLSTRMGFSSSTAVLMGTTLQLGGLIGAVFMGPLIDRLEPFPGTVVCVAGLLGRQDEAAADPAQAELIMRTNYVAPSLFLGEIANRMERRGSGTIIGISSVAGDRGRAANYLYGSAKAGLTAFLSGLRNRLAGSGVHVITVKPGFVDTRMTEGMKLPPLLTAQPDEVGRAVLDAEARHRDILYVRAIWRPVMAIICLVPERLFKRMRL